MTRPDGALRAVIADDEAGARQHLRALLHDCRVRVVAECATGDDALAAVSRSAPDVVCLDVRMPGLDGLETARRLGGAAAVIFTTGFGDHAAAAWEIGAADYLLKPLSSARVAEAIRRVRLWLRAAGAASATRDAAAIPDDASGGPSSRRDRVPRVLIPAYDHRLALPPETIHFVEARHSDVVFHTDRGVFRLRTSLARLERVLAPWGFLRTHRAYLVNLARVQALIPWSRHAHSVLIEDGKETHVPVAKSRLAAFRGSMIWIPSSGGPRSGSGTAGQGRDRGRRQPGTGPRDRRGAGG
ncbi:MAG: LytTR family DNA-binding domain-containing protein [Armatimonadota bacterium]|nr:LytTR family DNA-binding domain-containing protein [Armatimonadota bacterium]